VSEQTDRQTHKQTCRSHHYLLITFWLSRKVLAYENAPSKKLIHLYLLLQHQSLAIHTGSLGLL